MIRLQVHVKIPAALHYLNLALMTGPFCILIGLFLHEWVGFLFYFSTFGLVPSLLWNGHNDANAIYKFGVGLERLNFSPIVHVIHFCFC